MSELKKPQGRYRGTTLICESPTAKLLSDIIDNSPISLSQDSLAIQSGLGKNGNMVTQVKTGRSRIPPHSIIPLCEVLGVDPKPVIASALAEYFPVVEELHQYLLDGESLSADESVLLSMYRESKARAVKRLKVSGKNNVRLALEDEGKMKKVVKAFDAAIVANDQYV